MKTLIQLAVCILCLAFIVEATADHRTLRFIHMRKAGGSTALHFIKKTFLLATKCCTNTPVKCFKPFPRPNTNLEAHHLRKCLKTCGLEQEFTKRIGVGGKTGLKLDIPLGNWTCPDLTLDVNEYLPVSHTVNSSIVTVTTIRNPIDRHISLFFYESILWRKHRLYKEMSICNCSSAPFFFFDRNNPRENYPNCKEKCTVGPDKEPVLKYIVSEAMFNTSLWYTWMDNPYNFLTTIRKRGDYIPNYYARRFGSEETWTDTNQLISAEILSKRIKNVDLLLSDHSNISDWDSKLKALLVKLPQIDDKALDGLTMRLSNVNHRVLDDTDASKKFNHHTELSKFTYRPKYIRLADSVLTRIFKENAIDIQAYEHLTGTNLKQLYNMYT